MTVDELLGITCDEIYTTVEEVYWSPYTRQFFIQDVVNRTAGKRLFGHSGVGGGLMLSHVTSNLCFTGADYLKVVVQDNKVHVTKDYADGRVYASMPLSEFETVHDIVSWTRMVGMMVVEVDRG